LPPRSPPPDPRRPLPFPLFALANNERNGDFEFENPLLQQRAVAAALNALQRQGIFNARTRDQGYVDGERTQELEYWLRKRIHGTSQMAGGGSRW